MRSPWARLLYWRMSEVSEDCYAARWLIGNEVSLWRMLQGLDRRYGHCLVSDEVIEELRVLSVQANGWIWTGHPEPYQEARLVSFDEWERLLVSMP